ncbi:NUDIX domain-containing protein [Bizionia myxarmorum]|uniref:GDP-mannose pyrophosphatase n=1 Tax=Bizionia myxarmorum TaxID=291186 RepID=A0A5D0QZG4_9FLAO|nr:NUDIX hydrolase [Bizionia myxarmorum]TYB74006.1 NUDIX hydrolase [Bizionia myxarmorum]
MKYQILKEDILFDDFFQIKKAKITHDLFNGDTVDVERFCFERGDSVAILLYEKDTDSLLFTKQFRYPTIKETDGWILELTAGSIEPNEEPEHRVLKEVEEEIGYQVNNIEFISSFFVSPGGTSERIFLYYSEVTASNKVFEGSGMINEKEDIQLVKIKTQEVFDLTKKNHFQDAKTLIGIQWFMANKIS